MERLVMGMPVCAMILYRIRPRQPMSTSGTDCPKWGSANCLTLLVPLRERGGQPYALGLFRRLHPEAPRIRRER